MLRIFRIKIKKYIYIMSVVSYSELELDLSMHTEKTKGIKNSILEVKLLYL